MCKTFIALLLVLGIACSTPPTLIERSAIPASAAQTAPTKTEQATSPEPSQVGDVICRSVTSEEFGRHRVVCEPQPPPPPKPAQACEDGVAFVDATTLPQVCYSDCNLCVIPQETITKMDAALDKKCDEMCKEAACAKKEEECVRDKVVNLASSSTCIAQSRACQKTPKTPAICVELKRYGECTCKCVPKAKPAPARRPG